MTGSIVQQPTHTRTVFDCLPSTADLMCKLAQARGDSEESIAETRHQFEAIDTLNPFRSQNGGDN